MQHLIGTHTIPIPHVTKATSISQNTSTCTISDQSGPTYTLWYTYCTIHANYELRTTNSLCVRTICSYDMHIMPQTKYCTVLHTLVIHGTCCVLRTNTSLCGTSTHIRMNTSIICIYIYEYSHFNLIHQVLYNLVLLHLLVCHYSITTLVSYVLVPGTVALVWLGSFCIPVSFNSCRLSTKSVTSSLYTSGRQPRTRKQRDRHHTKKWVADHDIETTIWPPSRAHLENLLLILDS